MTSRQFADLRRLFPQPNREAVRITLENGKVPGYLEAQCVMGLLIGSAGCFEFDGVRRETPAEDALRQFRAWMDIGVRHGQFSRQDSDRMLRVTEGVLAREDAEWEVAKYG